MKLDYIVRELWILAWGASVQRANLYRKDIESNAKPVRLFHEKVVTYLSSSVIPQYCKMGVSEEQHYANIKNLIDYANSVDPQLLGQYGYKYGVAQKLLNLILKYQWCLGLVSEPPHCPVDKTVIDKTRYKNKINWTAIVERADYQDVIEDVKRLASLEGLSPSMWELLIFSRR